MKENGGKRNPENENGGMNWKNGHKMKENSEFGQMAKMNG
jgi:hypothetical protein